MGKKDIGFTVKDESKLLDRHSLVYGFGLLSKIVGFLMLPVYTRVLSPNTYLEKDGIFHAYRPGKLVRKPMPILCTYLYSALGAAVRYLAAYSFRVLLVYVINIRFYRIHVEMVRIWRIFTAGALDYLGSIWMCRTYDVWQESNY